VPASDPKAEAAAEEEKKAAAEDKSLELAEQNAKLAEKLEATAQRVASIAESVAERPVVAAQPAAPAPEKRLTEEQVMALVENKQISLAQGMAYLRRLAAEDARAEAQRTTAAALAELGTRAQQQQTAQMIAEYKQAIPELGQKHSAEWTAVLQRYTKLVGEGYPETLQTELTALRELYGREPAKRRDEEPRERTKERATRGAETPSSSASRAQTPSRRAKGAEADPDLPADHRTYVEHMIRIGQYKGWDDPRVAKYAERAKSAPARRRA